MANDGGPAFARASGEARDAMGNSFWPCAQEGISVLDYFAAAALTGFCALQSCYEDCSFDEIASNCYAQAEAMLAESERRKQE